MLILYTSYIYIIPSIKYSYAGALNVQEIYFHIKALYTKTTAINDVLFKSPKYISCFKNARRSGNFLDQIACEHLDIIMNKEIESLVTQKIYRVFQYLFPPPHNILALPPQIYLSQVQMYVF